MAFVCMCCQKTKPSGQAAGAFVYKTDDPKLLRAMQTAGGPRVGTYVLCRACVRLYSNDVLHEKITAKFAQAGLFGPTMAVASRVEHGRLPEELELGKPGNPHVAGTLRDLSSPTGHRKRSP